MGTNRDEMIVAATIQSLVFAIAGVVLLLAVFSVGVITVRRQRELYPSHRPRVPTDEDEERHFSERGLAL